MNLGGETSTRVTLLLTAACLPRNKWCRLPLRGGSGGVGLTFVYITLSCKYSFFLGTRSSEGPRDGVRDLEPPNEGTRRMLRPVFCFGESSFFFDAILRDAVTAEELFNGGFGGSCGRRCEGDRWIGGIWRLVGFSSSFTRLVLGSCWSGSCGTRASISLISSSAVGFILTLDKVETLVRLSCGSVFASTSVSEIAIGGCCSLFWVSVSVTVVVDGCAPVTLPLSCVLRSNRWRFIRKFEVGGRKRPSDRRKSRWDIGPVETAGFSWKEL